MEESTPRFKGGPALNRKRFRCLLLIVCTLVLLTPAISLPVVSADAAFPVERILSSVCTIETEYNQGSGVFITSEGHVLTNAHVLDGEREVTIYYNGGTYKGYMLRQDSILDLAILDTDIVGAPPAEFAATEDIHVGMDAYAVGSPLGLPQTVSRGIVSVIGQEIEGQLYIQSDVAVYGGSSGGPLCSADGTVIGLNTFTMGDYDGITFAVPNPVLLDFIHREGLLKETIVTAIPGIPGIPGYYDGTYYGDVEFDPSLLLPQLQVLFANPAFTALLVLAGILFGLLFLAGGIVLVFYLRHVRKRRLASALARPGAGPSVP
jgi:hypothetical protein